MEDKTKFIAIRLLREQIVERTRKNEMIRQRFGDRITIALTSECDQRDREVAALEETIALLEPPAE